MTTRLKITKRMGRKKARDFFCSVRSAHYAPRPRKIDQPIVGQTLVCPTTIQATTDCSLSHYLLRRLKPTIRWRSSSHSFIEAVFKLARIPKTGDSWKRGFSSWHRCNL